MFPDALEVEKFGIDSMQPHRIAAPDVGVALGIRMEQVDDAALAHHRVEVEILLEPFPELHR